MTDDYDPQYDDPRPDNPIARAIAYAVSCLPEDGLGSDSWDVTVEYAGAFSWGIPTPPERHWAVRLRGHWSLSRAGTWDEEDIPGEREDDWLAEHRFTFEDAMDRAKAAAPHVVVNGETPADKYARRRPARRTA